MSTKFVLGVLVFFSNVTAFGAVSNKPVQITAELLVNGEVVSAPRIVTIAGEKAEIVVGEVGQPDMVRMAVVMTPVDSETLHETVLLDMELEHRRGDHTIKASPQILTKLGSQALVNLDSAKDNVQLKIKAIRARSGTL